MRIAIVLITIILSWGFLALPALAQEKPTLEMMQKNLQILNLQLRVKQLEYHDLKDRRDGLVAQVESAEVDYNKTANERNELRQRIKQAKVKPAKPVVDNSDDE